jgi:hypothetical protein
MVCAWACSRARIKASASGAEDPGFKSQRARHSPILNPIIFGILYGESSLPSSALICQKIIALTEKTEPHYQTKENKTAQKRPPTNPRQLDENETVG